MGTGSAVFPIDDFFNSLSFSFRTQQIAAAIVYMSSSSLVSDSCHFDNFYSCYSLIV